MSTATKLEAGGVVCDSQCGCQVPCPGDVTCRCVTTGATTMGGNTDRSMEEEHKRCRCGELCGCNPCTCPKSSETTGTGKSHCRCGEGCTCATCAA